MLHNCRWGQDESRILFLICPIKKLDFRMNNTKKTNTPRKRLYYLNSLKCKTFRYKVILDETLYKHCFSTNFSLMMELHAFSYQN